MAGVCTGPGVCDTTPIGTGKNWLRKVNGLPLYIRAIAQALIRSGHSESEAVQLAVGTVKRWATGAGKVTPATRARAAKASAEWESKKAASHSLSNEGDRMTVDLSFDPSEKRGFGGKWTAGEQKQAQANQMAKQRSSYAMNAGKPGSASKSSSGGSGGGSSASKAKSTASKQAASDAASAKPATKSSTARAAAINSLSAADRTASASKVPPAGFKWTTKGSPDGAPVLVPSATNLSNAVMAPSTQAKPSTASKVLAGLKEHYPSSVLGWVTKATWRYEPAVPLSSIDMSRRPGGRDPKKVAGIAQAVSDGKTMDPVVLVQTSDGLEAADGYHRTLGLQKAGKKTTPAFIASGVGDHGPWETAMHDAKLNLSQRVRRVFARKSEPTPQVPRVIELANGSMAERMFPDEAAVRKGCARLPKMTDPKMRTATRIMIKNRAEALGMDVGSLNLSVPMNLRAGAREAAKKAGATLPGTTSYPTQTRAEFDKAVLAVGRGGAQHNKIRAYLIRRAKAEGWTDGIPSNWNADGSIK